METVLDSFATFCHQAGPLKCKVYEPTVLGIQTRLTAARRSLATSPIPVPFSDKGPFLLTEPLLANRLFWAAYSPLSTFPLVANTIIAIEARNASEIAASFSQQASYECDCKRPQISWQRTDMMHAFHAIACSDAPPIPFDQTEFENHLANLTAISPLAGPFWAGLRLGCTQWPIRAKWRYDGPLEANETSHPILVLSPSFDPVCPISDARRVQGRYKGSRLLEQHSYGHCTIAAPSLCTALRLREYFVNGTLPEEGTVCEPDILPFEGAIAQALSVEDQELLKALEDLSAMTPQFGPKF
jgi:pimeloyl-ACP methyl ester carboxylesterase